MVKHIVVGIYRTVVRQVGSTCSHVKATPRTRDVNSTVMVSNIATIISIRLLTEICTNVMENAKTRIEEGHNCLVISADSPSATC